jgi:hypothetical protein
LAAREPGRADLIDPFGFLFPAALQIRVLTLGLSYRHSYSKYTRKASDFSLHKEIPAHERGDFECLLERSVIAL